MKFLLNPLLIIFIFIIASCSTNIKDDIKRPVRVVQTKILMNGDIDVGTEFPMFHTSDERPLDSDLYGIQIYARAKASSSSAYKAYAYGIFDDLSKVIIGLPDNMLYKVMVSMVANGKNMLYSLRGEYRDPFSSGSRYFSVTNAFAETPLVVLTGLYLGKATVGQDKGLGYSTYIRPAIGRYSGEVVDFEPGDDCDIRVELKTVNFGVRLSAIGLTDGYIELSLDGSPSMRLYAGQESAEMTFSLAGYGTTSVWLDESYSETVVFRAKWVRLDKSEISLGPVEGLAKEVKRRYMFPVVTRVTWSQVGGSITVKDEEMIDQPETAF